MGCVVGGVSRFHEEVNGKGMDLRMHTDRGSGCILWGGVAGGVSENEGCGYFWSAVESWFLKCRCEFNLQVNVLIQEPIRCGCD